MPDFEQASRELAVCSVLVLQRSQTLELGRWNDFENCALVALCDGFHRWFFSVLEDDLAVQEHALSHRILAGIKHRVHTELIPIGGFIIRDPSEAQVVYI